MSKPTEMTVGRNVTPTMAAILGAHVGIYDDYRDGKNFAVCSCGHSAPMAGAEYTAQASIEALALHQAAVLTSAGFGNLDKAALMGASLAFDASAAGDECRGYTPAEAVEEAILSGHHPSARLQNAARAEAHQADLEAHPVIPDEAVEAALVVLRRDDLWDLSDREECIAILEAAAPHLLAGAYDLGLSVGYYLERGWVYEDALKMPVDRSGDNPYR